VVASHFSVIVRGSAQLFVAGPPVVAMARMGEAPDKEELGGARAQTAAGAVDNEAADEEDALAQLGRFLSYLPGASGRVRRASPPPTPSIAAKRSSCRSSRAMSVSRTTCDGSVSWCSTAARPLSSAAASAAR
jgi:acetyl-CoA carboxylase carboxyltransferase component